MKNKYQVIYADPPWNYRVYSKKGLGRSAESHYPTMSIEEIRALPVGDLADKDCALFLWVTMPCLLDGLSALEAWGFTYIKRCRPDSDVSMEERIWIHPADIFTRRKSQR